MDGAPYALHLAAQPLLPAVEYHLGRFARRYVPELGLLEVALHVERVDVHQCHQRHAGAGIVADPGLQVGDVTIARGMNPGLGQRPSGLLQIGLGHLVGRLHRLGIEAGLVHRLGGDDAARQAAAPVRLVLRLVEIRFGLGQRR